MARARGRDQGVAAERLMRIVGRLSASEFGLITDDLLDTARFEGSTESSAKRQLQRDIQHLKDLGWDIYNASPPGIGARYRLRVGDNRLRVQLTVPQAAALQRAALLARRTDLLARLGLPTDERKASAVQAQVVHYTEVLDEVMAAMRHRGRLRCRYKGKDRLLEPQLLAPKYGDWYLRCLEDGAEPVEASVKNFLVSRMSEVEMVGPGTARRIHVSDRVDLHPLGRLEDPPVDVVLRTTPEFRADVVRWMRAPNAEEERGGLVEMRYRVTNRSAFRHRLYELGTRVELLGPPEIRDEVLAELAAFVEGKP